MVVVNRVSFDVLAVVWYACCAGNDYRIRPGETSLELFGPYMGKASFDGEQHDAYAAMPIEVTCHEGPHDQANNIFHVARGEPLVLGVRGSKIGVTICHHEDADTKGIPIGWEPIDQS